LTEIAPLAFTVSTDAAVTVTPITGMTAAQLLAPGTAPSFESVKVTLTNVAITANGSTANGHIATGKQAGMTFGVQTDIIPDATLAGGCYSTMTGFITNLEAGSSAATTKPNAFGFIVSDLGPTGTACN
jgi:hypothetical protein